MRISLEFLLFIEVLLFFLIFGSVTIKYIDIQAPIHLEMSRTAGGDY
jgi:hypothetical protein